MTRDNICKVFTSFLFVKIAQPLRCLLFIVFLFCNARLNATHLVGGEMNYQYIGDDKYQISLTVYRDCFLGQAPYDVPAYILVYEGDGTFLGYYSIVGDPEINLPVEIHDDCLVVPPSICVERKEYTFVGEGLDVNSTGYYLSYQRCCRNESILNAYAEESGSPDDIGMNLMAYIPPRSQLINSNPVFNDYPPIAICVNKRIDYDHSAVDPDLDSLVYRLCTPLDALTPTNPSFIGYNYEEVPFREIKWKDPYRLDNLLGGIDSLRIDNHTGRLTGTPTRVGQFVVGVCVDEYRDGEKIGETRRDFQYNVAPCEKLSTSSFFVMDTICNSMDVVFRNESDGATSYLWDFGDGEKSEEDDPTHTYPDYGSYEVTLIAVSSMGCSDTLKKKLTLVEDKLRYNINDVVVCRGDSALLQVDIQNGAIRNIHWLIDPSVYTETPQLKFLPEETAFVKYDVYSAKGCVYNDSVFVDVIDKPQTLITSKPTVIYWPQKMDLSTLEHQDYIYEWTSKNTNTAPTSSQTNLFVTENQWVYLKVTDKKTACVTYDSIYLEIADCNYEGEFTITKSIHKECDYAEIQIDLTKENSNLIHQWNVGGDIYFEDRITLQIPYNLEVDYRLIIGDENICLDTIDMQEYIEGTTIENDISNYIVCENEGELILNLGVKANTDYSLTWGDYSDTLVNIDQIRISSEELKSLNYKVPVVLMHRGDTCVIEDTIDVYIKQTQVEIHAQPTAVYKDQEVTLSTQPDDFIKYEWLPKDLVFPNDEAVVQSTIDETTDFIVIVQDKDGCQAIDTFRVELKTECSIENVFIPTAFTPNGDGVNDIWKIRTEANIQIEYAIYNRWGEKVFESKDFKQGWDGYYKGKPADKGAYAYYLKIICENQTEIFNKGNITLIR